MTDYSAFIVFFLMLPVLTQIIFPLLLLVGYGLLRAVTAVFGRQKVALTVPKAEKVENDLQLSGV